jgi:hypothetical protein
MAGRDFWGFRSAPVGPGILGTNRWVGKVAGAYIAVYAGRSGQDASTGYVFAMSSDGAAAYSREVKGSGALRIVRAERH